MNATILDAFLTAVGTFAGNLSPALTVAYPGIEFTPPATGDWIEVQAFPNETLTIGMQNTGLRELRGFFQVSACTRPGAGVMGIQAIADAVIAAFTKGTTFGGARVERQPWCSSLLTMEDRIVIPVTVRYRALEQGA